MSDERLRELAAKAGIAPVWTDLTGATHSVAPETLRSLLAMFGLPCGTVGELRDSLARLAAPADAGATAPMLVARLGEPLPLPPWARCEAMARVVLEDGTQYDTPLGEEPDGHAVLPGLDRAGYHRVEIEGRELVVAAAPSRCLTVEDMAPGEYIFGLAAQIYGLRRKGDGGTGDMGGVAELAAAAGRQGADALALSPMHALFSADPGRFGPYSPSSRLFYNPLHADPAAIFGPERVRQAIEQAHLRHEMTRLEDLELVDWLHAARVKTALFRSLFDSFERADLAASPPGSLAGDFIGFRAAGGDMLLQHARFETLHARRLGEDPAAWSWRSWPAEWRDPASPAVAAFAEAHAREVQFHIFLQWLADRSLALAQAGAKRAGMRIGLISDLAIGMDGGGSHAWSRQREVLVGASVGAPPDYYNANGQDWGLTAFSPRALIAEGYAPYIATLRAALRHTGGVRIDHVMGLMRLWLVPEGASPVEGAYVSYPVESLFRLTALESLRHRAIVIGEDLGTLPHGFRERLAGEGIAGTQVLRFERDDGGFFRSPETWRRTAVATTSTHDLPTTAGWWSGRDIDVRAGLAAFSGTIDLETERGSRAEGRHFLWGALRHAGVAAGEQPAPDATQGVVDAAARFVAATPCGLAILPLEDALGVLDQPNLPGTVDEHPNWRRRLQGEAAKLLDASSVRPRLDAMRKRRSRNSPP
ncbi:MAG: 4-alpha-glucanotransferase [Hyphomicrobiales bacterium]